MADEGTESELRCGDCPASAAANDNVQQEDEMDMFRTLWCSTASDVWVMQSIMV